MATNKIMWSPKQLLVNVPNLQVVVAPEGDFWVAQALEIDYAAAGDSPDDAVTRFEAGLESTLKLHKSRRIPLKSAPPFDWTKFLSLEYEADAVRRLEGSPFEFIRYFKAKVTPDE